MLELIQGLRSERDLTVVMVTHDMGVAGWANRTVRMLDGQLAERGAAAQVAADRALEV